MRLNPFARKAEPTSADDELSPVGGGEGLAANDVAKRKQTLILAGAGACLLAGGSVYITRSDTATTAKMDAIKSSDIKVSTDDMVNKNLANKEWQAISENRFDAQDNQLKGVQGQQAQLDQLRNQVAALQGQNSSMANDGQRVLSAYQQENDQLKSQVAQARSTPAPPPGPTSLYGAGSPASYARPGAGAAGSEPAVPVSYNREVKTVSFTGGASGNGKRAEGGSIVYSDSPDYLPPNSFATARVIVGVDASAGVASQTDPLPVVLRITGPARSVADNGRVLTTKLEGCLVNGAARGDLSSEKVYIKLQKLTCAQPGGRFAVSEVKGFIAFGGKSGVRGRVVSREGGLVSQAFIAGLVGGIGRGFSANTESFLGGSNVTVNGQRQQLGLGSIAQGGIGEGVSKSADQVSKYLIERAEQYQPVIEMPTGIDVEIVFLEGAYVRN